MKEKISLTRSEFTGISTIVISKFENDFSEVEIKAYLGELFDRLIPERKKSFIEKHEKSFFLFVGISITFLLMKIAIEALFLK